MTLIELIIVISIMAVVAAAGSGAMITVLRTQNVAPNVLDENRGAQGLATYLAADVASTPPGSENVQPNAAPPPGCTGTVEPTSANVLRLSWTQNILGEPVTTFQVAYRYERGPAEVGTGVDWRLVRYSCTVTAPATSGTLTKVVVAKYLSEPPAGWTPGTAVPAAAVSAQAATITVRLTGVNGYTYSVTGSRLNQSAILCSAAIALSDPSPQLAAVPPAALAPPVTATVTLTGSGCGVPVLLSYDTGTTERVETVPANGVVPLVNDAVWRPGTVALTVSAGGVEVGSATLTVRGCELTVVGSPSPVGRVGGGLESPVTVSATPAAATAGLCVTPLTLRYTPNDAAGTPEESITMTPSGSDWVATIPTGGTWDAGSRLLSVQQAGADPRRFSFSLEVAPGSILPCTVTSFTTTPPAATLTAGNTLPSGGIALAATSIGSCAEPLRVGYTPVATVVTRDLTGGAGAWSLTLPDTEVWSAGTKTLTLVQANGSAVAGTPSVDVVLTSLVPPCTVAALSVAPPSVNLTAANTLGGTVTVSATTSGDCTGLKIGYPPAAGPTELALDGGPASWSVDLPSGEPWTTGAKTISLRKADGTPPAGAPTSATLTIGPAPCTVTSATASTADLTLINGGFLPLTSVTVNVTTTGECTGLRLGYTPQAAATFVPFTGGPTSWVVTLPTNQVWAAGAKTLQVQLASGAAAPGATPLPLNVQGPGCRVLGVAWSTPIEIRKGNNRLRNDEIATVTVNDAQTCSGLNLTFVPAASNPPATRLAITPGTVVQFRIDAGTTWSLGTKTYALGSSVPAWPNGTVTVVEEP